MPAVCQVLGLVTSEKGVFYGEVALASAFVFGKLPYRVEGIVFVFSQVLYYAISGANQNSLMPFM